VGFWELGCQIVFSSRRNALKILAFTGAINAEADGAYVAKLYGTDDTWEKNATETALEVRSK